MRHFPTTTICPYFGDNVEYMMDSDMDTKTIVVV